MSKSSKLHNQALNGASKTAAWQEPPVMHPAGRRSDQGTAFLPDPYDAGGAPALTRDGQAESMAEEFVLSATAAQEMTEDDRDDRNDVSPGELGGPFTETAAAEELAT